MAYPAPMHSFHPRYVACITLWQSTLPSQLHSFSSLACHHGWDSTTAKILPSTDQIIKVSTLWTAMAAWHGGPVWLALCSQEIAMLWEMNAWHTFSGYRNPLQPWVHLPYLEISIMSCDRPYPQAVRYCVHLSSLNPYINLICLNPIILLIHTWNCIILAIPVNWSASDIFHRE